MIALTAFLFLASYLLGSVPFGLILTKIFAGVDLREIGSKNIGTTNVLRTGNKLLALFTLLCDMGKGALVILIASGLPPSFALIIGFGAILGHCFPIWLKFKGGKGVATGFGVLLPAVPVGGISALATWLVIAYARRYSSLAALGAYVAAPVTTLIVYGWQPALICALISAFIWWRHKDNIKRLMAGTESKIGQK